MNPTPDVPPTPPKRSKSKISRLPKAVRDRLNQMMRDGVIYREIIEKLGEDGKDLNEPNLTAWYQGPHQEWLKQQESLESEREKWEFTCDVAKDVDNSNITQAAVQVAAKQIYQALNDLTPSAVADILTNKPEEYVRLVNAISRLSRDSLTFQKYRDACVQVRAEVARLRDPNRQFTDAETRAIVDRVDQILGFKTS